MTENIICGMFVSMEKAWNRGSIGDFIRHYTEDANVSGDTMIRGRDQILLSYKRAFPTQESMGEVALLMLSIERLTDTEATVLTEWVRKNSGDQQTGRSTLTIIMKDGEPRIQHDNSIMV